MRRKADWWKRLEPLVREVSVIHHHVYTARDHRSAGSALTRLRTRTISYPPGRWSFQVRNTNEIWARYHGSY